jgi:hypothetical protein
VEAVYSVRVTNTAISGGLNKKKTQVEITNQSARPQQDTIAMKSMNLLDDPSTAEIIMCNFWNHEIH